VALGAWLLSWPAWADISPPTPTEKTLELTLDGQDSFPELRFLAFNCRKSPRDSVLKTKSIECPSIQHPVRIFGFAEQDLNELFAMMERDAGTEESRKFLAAKAKTCGEIASTGVIRPGGGHLRFVSHYALERTPKGGCQLRQVSSRIVNEPDPPANEDPPSPATKPVASSPARVPTPSSGGSPRSSCGCRTAGGNGNDRAGFGLAALCLLWAARRKLFFRYGIGQAKGIE
jgi:MYXO-CTERM domain-containing protein